jgi:hypothetical protein
MRSKYFFGRARSEAILAITDPGLLERLARERLSASF